MKHAISLKLSLLVAAVLVLGIGTAALAYGPVPSPYAGLKNPFPWTDTGAQAQGKKLYDKSCAACHGANGGNLAKANFASADVAAKLEAEADRFFWTLSEGDLSIGMPPFKSMLSDEERWQVVTYLWALGRPAPATVAAPAPATAAGKITLSVDERRSATSPLILTAALSDAAGKPLSGEDVGFFLKKDFFAQDWMQIGQAASNKEGKAVIEYVPSEDGNLQLLARFGNLEATGGWAEKSIPAGYHVEVGLHLPAVGPEVAVGLTLKPVDMIDAPTGGLRLPGGTISWLLTFVGVILMIWATYFRVFRQVLAIPESHAGEGMLVKVVPIAAMCFVLLVGATLAFVLVHGPYTHLHLAP